MTSAIDPTVPIYGSPTTESVRNNFAIAASEISALQNLSGNYLPLSGGTLTGPLTLAANPTATLQAATKGYVDSAVASGVASYLPLAGGTMTGFLTLSADPTATHHAATKSYVDNAVAAGGGGSGGGIPEAPNNANTYGRSALAWVTVLPTAGGTITNLTVSGTATLNNDPTSARQAATKNYVDTAALPLLGGTLTGNLTVSTPNGTVQVIGAGGSFVLNGTTGGVAPPSAALAPTLNIAGQNNGFPGVSISTWGTGAPYIIGRGAGGTVAAPTATASGQILLSIVGRGYDTGYFTADAARIRIGAAEAYTTTAHGSYLSFMTTPTGTTNPVEALRVNSDGALLIPATVTGASPGAGGISVSGGYYRGGVPVSDPNWSFVAASHNYIGNLGGSAAPPNFATYGMQLIGIANQQIGIQKNAFGANSLLVLARAEGTPAAPAATGANRVGAVYAYGYDGSNYQMGAAITFESKQTWTASARGTAVTFYGTPNGSTSIAAMMTVGMGGLGGVAVPNGVVGGDLGMGTVNVSSGYYIGGNNILNNTSLSGNPTCATQATGDNSTRLANTAFVRNYAGATFLPLTGGTLSGGFYATGLIGSMGSAAGFNFDERGNASNTWSWYASGGAAHLWMNGYSDLFLVSTNATYPATDNYMYCGFGGQAWVSVNAYNFGTMSDIAHKRDLEPLPDCLGIVCALPPKRFKFNNGADHDAHRDDTHWGFVAQDVQKAMEGLDFGGHRDDPGGQSILYNELVAVLWKACQEMAERLAELEARVATIH